MINVNILHNCSGTNTALDPVRVNHDQETRVSDLTASLNVRVSESGRIDKAYPLTLLESGNFHSLYKTPDKIYVGKDKALYSVVIYKDSVSLTGIRSSLSGDPISFQEHAGITYYTNGTQNGKLVGDTSSPWKAGEWPGGDTDHHYSDPPVGSFVFKHGGRIGIVYGDTMYFAKPGMPDLFRLTDPDDNYTLDSEIILAVSVGNGLFASTTRKIYYLEGFPGNFREMEVWSYPALKGSLSPNRLPLSEIGIEAPGECAFFVTTKGGTVVMPGGGIYDMTRKKVVYPAGRYGASIINGFDLIQTVF